MDIAAWLRELGLERYEEAFRENEIDAEILPKLTADDLKDLASPPSGTGASSSKRLPPWLNLLWRRKRNRAPEPRPHPELGLRKPSAVS